MVSTIFVTIIKFSRQIIHVDIPPIDDIENVAERNVNWMKREDSINRLILSLATCYNKRYKPKNSDEINDRVSGYMTEKEKSEKLVEEITNKYNKLQEKFRNQESISEEQKRELDSLKTSMSILKQEIDKKDELINIQMKEIAKKRRDNSLCLSAGIFSACLRLEL